MRGTPLRGVPLKLPPGFDSLWFSPLKLSWMEGVISSRHTRPSFRLPSRLASRLPPAAYRLRSLTLIAQLGVSREPAFSLARRFRLTAYVTRVPPSW
jgi:hypothetical protein